VTNKKYYGSCYIGVVGSENEYGPCRDSIEAIQKRKNDSGPHFNRGTKGYESRQAHINNWYSKTKHAFLLLLDHDMIFPADTLERLRLHRAPFVSGFYMRRTVNPVLPVWYEQGKPGVMPMKPLTAALEKNKTYPLGASGWGCMLIHRDVITATRKLLKGEQDVIEDDMDIYPYDLKKLLKARQYIVDASKGKPMNEKKVQFVLETFANEIRPLRGIKDEIVGSDIRFPFYAQLAGFPLMGDTGVMCYHATNYPVGLDDWLNQPIWNVRDLALHINNSDRAEVEKIRKATA
jgi:hypothetical protein